jgi:hypothetical protein
MEMSLWDWSDHCIYLIIHTVGEVLSLQAESCIFIVNGSSSSSHLIEERPGVELQTFLRRFNAQCPTTFVMDNSTSSN